MFVQKFQPSFKSFFLLLHLQKDPVGLHLLRFGLFLIVFDGRDDFLELHVPSLDELVGAVDYVRIEAQLAGDLKGIGLAGDPDIQFICRAQSLHVEFHGGVLNAFFFYCKFLELVVVGGCHHAGLVGLQSLQDGYGQRRAFRGVRACSQLVQKHQRTVARLSDEFHRVLHVRTEGGKALLYGLFVTDIAEYLFVYRHAAG